ncbi:MAG: polysaccharide deacetylase family protein [Oscillospiraceae bacterium]|nr:polysaccharide deacetylase family protein [Oscillospiraceae bacterium]
MKSLMITLLAAIIMCLPVHATEVSLYSADGREIVVKSEDEERMRAEGWYGFDEVYTALYSEDGRAINALNSRIEEWKSVGWYENIADVQTMLYSADGRELTVWNADVEAFLQVGWFRTLEEVQTTLYSADGREITVWNADVEAYLQVGWFRTTEEVQTTLYSADGREITVWNADVEAYLQVGWHRTKDEVRTVLYNQNGEEKAVWNAEVDAYLAAGWLREKQRPGIDPNRPMVALTFDDGPGPYTEKILNCLVENNAKATFFVVGNRLKTYSGQLKREAELGMEIGCHSWSHANLTTLGASAISSQIKDTNNLVKELTGVYPATLRPPYGSHNAAVRSAAGAPIILWSIDTLDWKTKNADSTYNSVMNNVKDGDIILMHDIHSATADAALRIIPALIERGYQLVTVSELGEYKAGGLGAGQVYGRIN